MLTAQYALRPRCHSMPNAIRLYGAPRRLPKWLVFLACVLTQPVLAAETPKTPAIDATTATLQRIQTAARSLDYSGVFTYQQGGNMSSSRVIHLVDGTGERERLEILDGEPREYVRHNDEIQCLIPEKKAVVRQQRRGDRFPGLLIDDGKNVSDHYSLKTGKSLSRIAGRACTVLELVPKDALRYGYRLCADAKTGLLLKAQTLGARQHVIDQVTFTSLQIGAKVDADQLASRWDTTGWSVIKPVLAPVDLAKLGWRIPAPSGFRGITQVSRAMEPDRKVSQLVLSDGLAAISVFIEAVAPAHNQELAKGAVREGIMNIFGTRIGDYWFTAIGEVPAQTLRELAERTQYVPLSASK